MRRRSFVTRFGTGLALAGAAMIVLATAAPPGGAATLPGPGIRHDVAALVRTTYPDVPVGNVACPASVPKRSGATFHCTVQLPGAFLVVDGTVGAGSAVTLAAAHAVLPKAQLEQFVAANASLPATVDCGPAPFRVARPGQVVSCRAALADGTARTVGVTVADTAGNVTISAVD